MTEDTDIVHARLTAHIASANNQIDRLRKVVMYTIAVSVAAILLVMGSLIIYVNHTRNVGDQRWCSLMVSLDKRYQALPSNASGDSQELANNIHRLRSDLKC